MPKFIITEEQVNAVLHVLGEFPAKFTLPAIDILRGQLVIFEPEKKAEKSKTI